MCKVTNTLFPDRFLYAPASAARPLSGNATPGTGAGAGCRISVTFDTETLATCSGGGVCQFSGQLPATPELPNQLHTITITPNSDCCASSITLNVGELWVSTNLKYSDNSATLPEGGPKPGDEREAHVFFDPVWEDPESVTYQLQPKFAPQRNVQGTTVKVRELRRTSGAIYHAVDELWWYGTPVDNQNQERTCSDSADTGIYTGSVKLKMNCGLEYTVEDLHVKADLGHFDDRADWRLTDFAVARLGAFARISAPINQICVKFTFDPELNLASRILHCATSVDTPEHYQYHALAAAEESAHCQQFLGNLNWSSGGTKDVLTVENILSRMQGVEGDPLVGCDSGSFLGRKASEANAKIMVTKRIKAATFALVQDLLKNSKEKRCWVEYSAKKHIGWTPDKASYHYQCGYRDCFQRYGTFGDGANPPAPLN